MKNNLRVLFMGTPDFALGVLKKIFAEGFNLCGVVTAPDKQAGRGKKTRSPVVKQWAVSQNITVYQPKNLKSEEFYSDLQDIQPDVIVVVAFRMLPEKVWRFPEEGTFNLHASLLPDYRGAAPIHWALINGERKTGVTTFFIDKAIDTGEIIDQKEIHIDDSDDVGSLHDKLMDLGSELVIDTLNNVVSNNMSTKKQIIDSSQKKAPKLDRETTQINWHQTQEKVYNFIRGLSPFPCSWTRLDNNEQTLCKIYKVIKTSKESNQNPGTIYIDNKKIYVTTVDYDLEIENLQLQNKRRMDAKDAINGQMLSYGQRFIN
ncbi:MAG: methionyl-tRNA formyltransferase [Psychroflexus sp.]|nr:methionyl-tRNA formyltransferase [Psychroflexus sp.]